MVKKLLIFCFFYILLLNLINSQVIDIPLTMTKCESNINCGSDSYCAFLFGVCKLEKIEKRNLSFGERIKMDTGFCKKKPDSCSNNYEPVCGCDGNTYANQCHANLAGVNILKYNACDYIEQNNYYK
eukprot:TRINITY_DN953_c0_g1_i1.p1 TRINITY_DN953_c0_g1~~TRINITY_DN953_c0_g1_i1.p1  ORF type:complete len:127 (-),score=20.46 TRINITY_DN953_c0_g1_i1:124-504(-)